MRDSIEVELSAVEREVVAEVDEVKMSLVFTNLIENAIKYNKELGEVRVSLNADTQYFYVTIQDTGVGIPKESLEHVFERFYRVDKARTREMGGTGLGLSIAKEILDKNKIKNIKVELKKV